MDTLISHRLRLLPALVVTAAVMFGTMLGTSVVRAAPFELTQASIADLENAMDKGRLTSEKLTQLYLARIKAYDKQGPAINAVITLNPSALKTARALDAERKAKGPRGPLHGIPVILKDNYNTADMPTTAGSFLLKGSIPPDDAFLVKKLRDAGAVILAKMNLSEFASGGAHSSIGGQTLNPHDLTRTPSGSSGGTGAGIAAVFAPLGMGTDTGGSIRGPSTSNGVVGLKPTRGLLSRNGIVPLALTFDTGGQSQKLTSPRDGFIPNESRWALFKDEANSGTLSNPQYLAVRDHALPLVRAEIEGILASNQLDAIVYPTSPRRPARIDAEPPPGAGGESATNFANLTGFPDLIVPAGFTTGGLPVGISFFGPAFSEPKLLALGYSFEQATQARRLPAHTPALPGENIGD